MKRGVILAFMIFGVLGVMAQSKAKNTTNKTLELSNSKICVKQDLTRGGAIYYISKSDEERNIVNIYDEGRYIQQSYYAGNNIDRQAEGQAKAWSPWAWNPIQVGG